MTVGEKIKKLRKENKLTQEELAEALGLSKGAISQFENDLNMPSTKVLFSLAKHFAVPIDTFYLNKDINRRFLESFNLILTEKRIKDIQDFCVVTRMPLTTVEHALDGTIQVPDALLKAMADKFGISYDWLLTGEKEAQSIAEPFLQYGYSKDQQMGMNTLQEIYFVPVPAQAGFLSHVSDKVYKNNLVRIQLPPDYTGINYIFEVDGDSMYPTFTNGDHVGCRHLESKKYFRYGEPYLLDIGDGGILLKRVLKHENPSLVILRSDNILYQDIEVERQDILHAFLVTTRLSKNVGRSSLDLKN